MSELTNHIVENFDVYKWLIYAISIKYAGKGFFNLCKGIVFVSLLRKKFRESI